MSKKESTSEEMNQQKELSDSGENEPDVVEDADVQEETEAEKGEEEVENEKRAKQANEKNGEKKRPFFFRKKGILLAVTGGVTLLVTMVIGPGQIWKEIQGLKDVFTNKGGLSGGPLKEEKLKSFYVPLSPGSSGLLVRLDISVKWDRYTRARYKREEPRIRDQLYQSLLKMAREGKDFQDEGTDLEVKLQQVVKKSLGVMEIEFNVVEIKIL